MKAKLIKTEVNYILEDDKGVVIASTSLNKEGLSLSLKNCQAIERGYDLDELAEKYAHYMNDEDGTSDIDFKVGFQKALEILGDKKFSEEDMIKFSEYCLNNNDCFSDLNDNLSKFQSLQQTEWDVEILEECLDKNCDGVNRKGECITTGKPKLDENGCLILKRI